MLKKTAIMNLTKKIERMNRERITIRYYIDTNGTLLDSDFIRSFPNLQLHIPLSTPQDHNFLRSNSFEKVFKNVKEYASLIDGKKYSLVIRYNAHKGNIELFEKLITMIEAINIPYHVDVERIMDNGIFTNNLSENEFDKWYCDMIYPILCKHNIQTDILPKVGIYRHCSGSNCLSRKYLSNGQNVLCDGISKDCIEGNQALQPLEERCINCYDFGYCGGNKNCEPHCDGTYKFKEGARYRVTTYTKLMNSL